MISISFENTPKYKIVYVELSWYPELHPELNFRFLTANPHKKNFSTYS